MNQNNLFKISIRIFLVLILFPTFTFAYYHSVINPKKLNVSYGFEKGNYKIHLKETNYLSFKSATGFSFYLPSYVTDFRIEFLRSSSKGLIYGALGRSRNVDFTNVIKPSLDNLDYFQTNPKDNKKQLNHLNNGQKIYYDARTSLVFEANNLSSNRYLNRSYFFTFDKTKDAKALKNLAYSYYLILDKSKVDSYVKRNFQILDYEKKEFQLLHTYLNNLLNKRNIKKESIKKEKKVAVIKTKPKKVVPAKKQIYLNRTKIVFMKEFEYKKFQFKINNDTSKIEIKKQLDELYKKITHLKNAHEKRVLNINYEKDFRVLNAIESLKEELILVSRLLEDFNFVDSRIDYTLNYDLYKKIYESIGVHKSNIDSLLSFLPKEKLVTYNQSDLNLIDYNFTKNSLENIIKLVETTKEENSDFSMNCYNNLEKFNEKCMNYKGYYDNFIQSNINNLKIPKKEFLLKYSDSKILNNIAVYYYKNLDLELSEFYLLEALKKAKTESVKELINFNMGILNLFINSDKSKILAVKYFEKTKLKEAYYNLGISYYNGFGVRENDKKAFNYFKKASDMNLNIAKENYEKMLKMGFK
ncbi:hypothetical protein GCM10012288_00690 [Malaciobacter pacificus]|uniref:beta-lactamase n=1 Tax=Malaciobacter pacificus TaxID=1080223 RepID=A0A5C2H2Y9_9BACT|nr:SEL1-like repeat protein [Malaciobacter pacificus]QEP33327.1 hypothetical protein APAC_0157 [Malaciobacter pacificus]GGD30489.1 hypothetical protein GCM10012288_00690 [Malaciobacter pacificus]